MTSLLYNAFFGIALQAKRQITLKKTQISVDQRSQVCCFFIGHLAEQPENCSLACKILRRTNLALMEAEALQQIWRT